MQTLWSGFGIPASNVEWTEVFVEYSTWVVLHDMPGVPTHVTLPVGTQGAILYTAQGEIWYAMGAVSLGMPDPGPIPPPAVGTAIPDTAFALGGVILSNQWRKIVFPNDGLQHTLQLVSKDPSPTVLITALTEMA